MNDEYGNYITKKLREYLILLCLTATLVIFGILMLVIAIVWLVGLLTGNTISSSIIVLLEVGDEEK